MDRRQQGKLIEDQACLYLQNRGLKLLQQNFTCRQGEIDLIMQDDDYVVFVEVRSRSSKDFGSAIEGISLFKLKRIIKSATTYLQQKKWLYKVNSRFDIIAMHTLTQKTEIEWLKNAFSVENVNL